MSDHRLSHNCFVLYWFVVFFLFFFLKRSEDCTLVNCAYFKYLDPLYAVTLQQFFSILWPSLSLSLSLFLSFSLSLSFFLSRSLSVEPSLFRINVSLYQSIPLSAFNLSLSPSLSFSLSHSLSNPLSFV